MDQNPETYSLHDSNHVVVLRYNPLFVGRGGENIVYEIPNHPEIVTKASTTFIKSNLNFNSKNKLESSILTLEQEIKAREIITKDAERFSKIRNYFGVENVANQRKTLAKVPITKNILSEIYSENPPQNTGEVWTILTVQKKAEEFEKRDRLSLCSGYSEENDVPPNIYNEVTTHLIFGQFSDIALDPDNFFTTQKPVSLRKLVEISKEDVELKKVLSDLILKCISYTTDTGEILDLAGSDNVIISNKNGSWYFKIVDGMYPAIDMIEKAKEGLNMVAINTKIPDRYKNYLLNVFNYVRTINGMAEILGVTGRINIIPNNLTFENFRGIDFQEILR